jgi:hypothetical protein
MVGAVSQVQTIRSRAPHTDGEAATVIALVFGAGAAVLAVETAWSTGIVRVIPPLLHGYADIAVTAAMIVMPFAVGFTSHTTALVLSLVVGAGGLARNARDAVRVADAGKACHEGPGGGVAQPGPCRHASGS